MAKKQDEQTNSTSQELRKTEKDKTTESEESSVVPVSFETVSESSKDPIRIMIEIAENKNISKEDKKNLITLSQNRFTNRRKMAYTALYAIIFSLGLLFLALFIDGISKSTILDSLKESQSLFTWIEGFLAAIVTAYYGVSAWKPAS